jgi:hypothetical protein
MRVGLINYSQNFGILPTSIISNFFSSNDDLEVIKNSEIIFFIEKTPLLPNNTFDTKKLFDVINSWGYCFENEIPVQNKIFVIVCNLNIGESNKINEILNPMNIEVVYVPPTSNIHLGKIVLGTLNQQVISTLTNLFVGMGFKNLSITSMSSKSAEIVNLLENTFYYMIHTYTKMVDEIMEDKGEMMLVNQFLGLGNHSETLDMKLKNEVLSQYIKENGTPINFSDEISHNIENHTIFTLNNILDTHTDLSKPIIIDGITYEDSVDDINPDRMFLILELLKRGYTVNIIESESFLKNKKMVLELSNDYGNKVKFYKMGSQIHGSLVSL